MHMGIHSIRNQDRRLSPDLAILFPTPLSHWLMGTPVEAAAMREVCRVRGWEIPVGFSLNPLTLQLF
jgi:hypothetical protein